MVIALDQCQRRDYLGGKPNTVMAPGADAVATAVEALEGVARRLPALMF
jgi:hypothetical protein